MVNKCCVCGCKSRYTSENRLESEITITVKQKITFHKFPIDNEELARKWLKNIARKDFHLSQRARRLGSASITPAFFNEIETMLEQVSLGADFVTLTEDLNVHVERTDDDHAANFREISELFNMRNRGSSMNFANRWVLRSALNFVSDGKVVREVGREFQRKGPEKANTDLGKDCLTMNHNLICLQLKMGLEISCEVFASDGEVVREVGRGFQRKRPEKAKADLAKECLTRVKKKREEEDDRKPGRLGSINIHTHTHVHGGTLDLVASSMELPTFACSVGPCGLFSDQGLVQVKFPFIFKLPVGTWQQIARLQIDSVRINNSDISFCIRRRKLQCLQCECTSNCELPNDVYTFFQNHVNFKWFCDTCLKVNINVSLLTVTKEVLTKVDNLSVLNNSIRAEMVAMKAVMDSNESKLNNFDCTNTVFEEKMQMLKKDMKSNFAGVVKRGIDDVGIEMKKTLVQVNDVSTEVKKTLVQVNDVREKEPNLMFLDCLKRIIIKIKFYRCCAS
ncbi:hypothetical protein HELRODRAFT_158443 [Helobdella robusta]|uniref:THAP-type domain-containing protein n=1 Tax=Helobdella robusta TaxID=6412 RepID=T1EMS7_HELRO|nr:hypothetical protein HELRODRAFT_158443 [Helobdella robusta]ESO12035.1 hypothetical protein HELRODRAFT_158443 [Helobdella robusta]